jgi:2-oxoisovalerate dehydrogenase E1 component
VAFGTIGNASTSEGIFLESINAAAVLQIPMLVSVWDDGYGISVPQRYHTAKESISKALKGYQQNQKEQGIEIFVVKGWDYPALCEAYQKASALCREQHIPVLFHVIELTQPQGHSTSGSHERYKPKERLEWEKNYDCNLKMRQWILKESFATEEELLSIEKSAKKVAADARKKAWDKYNDSFSEDLKNGIEILAEVEKQSVNPINIKSIKDNLQNTINPIKSDILKALRRASYLIRSESLESKNELSALCTKIQTQASEDYNSYLYSQSNESIQSIQDVKPVYDENSPLVDGREIMQACFDAIFERNPLVFAIGEDVGKIGDVNQGFAGLQEKYGEIRITDTGIREATIIGQGIGSALRGLRPIVEIQYLDYIYYAIQILSDDLACLQFRTKGGQKAPLIIRTRGHRLEGIWHSGSPMGMLLHSLRGIQILVPRNMTQAAAFYNALLECDEPALIIECLNGYRLKEKLPTNLSEIKLALGVPETLRTGSDCTIVTYGSMCRIVMEAAQILSEMDIDCEVIDVQTLLPFDVNHLIVQSIQKTNRVIFADEDVSGGASAYMMQKVLEEQNAYRFLDSKPATITAQNHRPAYGSDGDYFSKPNIEDVVEKVYELMHESNPIQFPNIF